MASDPAGQAGIRLPAMLLRLHEGVLARYGLRPSELRRWQEQRGR